MWRVLALSLLLVHIAYGTEQNAATKISVRGNEAHLQDSINAASVMSPSAIIQPREALADIEVPIGRKKVKIKLKKKHKKMLMKLAMTGILIKSALLPLAVGALKLLTAKAFMITMMALGLALAITYRSAKEKHVTTEIINLVPNKHRRSLSGEIPRFLQMLESYN